MKKFRFIQSAILAIIVIISISIFMPSFAQTKAAKIEELINRYYQLRKFNGCVLVAEDGKIIYENAIGFADIDQTVKLTLNHSFRLASVSKQFTAMAAMILRHRGTISYEDDIRKYIPELPYEDITISHLLTHTSGLPSYLPLLDQHWDTTNTGNGERKVASNKDALELLVKYKPKPKFKPGDRYEYCNTGYMVLALIVEQVTGQSFQEFMRLNVFAPLNMNRTYVNEPSGVLHEENRAHGFEPNPEGNGFIPSDHHYQNGMYGDGGIISTVRDMFKWDQALYTEKLVRKSSLKEAFSPAIPNDSSQTSYGFGWSIIPTEEGKIVAHGGGWLGFNSFILRDISKKLTIIQLCNMPGVSKDDLAFTIWDILQDREYSMPVKELVTFQVDMRPSIQHQIFEPWNGDRIIVRGSFNRWNANTKVLRDLDQDSIYVGKYEVFGKEGEEVEYKFLIQKHNGVSIWEDNPDSENPPYGNRRIFLTGNHQLIPIANFDHNLKIYKHPLFDFEFIASKNWQRVPHPEDELIYEVIDPDSIKHVLLWYTETEMDARHYLWKMANMKDLVLKEKPSKRQIKNHDAWVLNVSGHERRTPVRMLLAVIHNGKSQIRPAENCLFIIQIWCPEENYESHRDEIEEIFNSIKIKD